VPGTALAPPPPAPAAALRPGRRRRGEPPPPPLYCAACGRPVDVEAPRGPFRLLVATTAGYVRPGPYVHAGRCELALLVLETIRRGFSASLREERSAEELADVLRELWRGGRGPEPADVLASVRARLAELGRGGREPVLVDV
jgi:hypothetical protein